MQAKEAKDPRHQRVMKEDFSRVWAMYGAFDRLRLVITLAMFVFFAVIPTGIAKVLGWLPKNKDRKVVAVVPSKLWTLDYFTGLAQSSSVIIKGSDGTLFIRSPPEPITEIVKQITALGEPAVFLASLSHDSHVDKWMGMFPNAKVLAGRNDIATVSDKAKVDAAVEDSLPLLGKYGITKVIPTDWGTRDDCYLLVTLPSGGVAALAPCGVMTYPRIDLANPRSIFQCLAGFTGLRLARFGAWLFCTSTAKAAKQWLQVAQTPGLELLVSLHGPPIAGKDVGVKMAAVTEPNFERSKDLTPFGF